MIAHNKKYQLIETRVMVIKFAEILPSLTKIQDPSWICMWEITSDFIKHVSLANLLIVFSSVLFAI